MLKITPYLGIIVLIISLAGLFYPKLGCFLLLVFATLIIIAPFRGRWFCGNLCPRGSFVDFWLGPISRKVKIPSFFVVCGSGSHLRYSNWVHGLQDHSDGRNYRQSWHGLCNPLHSDNVCIYNL